MTRWVSIRRRSARLFRARAEFDPLRFFDTADMIAAIYDVRYSTPARKATGWSGRQAGGRRQGLLAAQDPPCAGRSACAAPLAVSGTASRSANRAAQGRHAWPRQGGIQPGRIRAAPSGFTLPARLFHRNPPSQPLSDRCYRFATWTRLELPWP